MASKFIITLYFLQIGTSIFVINFTIISVYFTKVDCASIAF